VKLLLDQNLSRRNVRPLERNALVYVVTRSGHRGAYLDFLASTLGLQSVYGIISFKMFIRLVAAEKLLFATLDDDMASFTIVTIVRSILGRPTTALFLRPAQCFISTKIKYGIKRVFFQALRRLPRLTLLTITPFSLAPQYRLIAHDGVHDPQYWDMHNGVTVIPPSKTDLSETVRQQANGRKIICALGTLSTIKGFVFLSETLTHHPTLSKSTFVVAAGSVPFQVRATADKFVESGGHLIDRRISDDEMASLYGVADLVWSCYAPEYDQASGIFGRAVQYGVPVLVRKDSLICRLALDLGVPAIPLEFGNIVKTAELMMQAPPEKLQNLVLDQHIERIGSWRKNFLTVIKTSLERKR